MKTLGVTLLLSFTYAISVQASKPDPEAIWSTISPSTNLTWTACYDTFECARFQVPLDWANPQSDRNAVIAVLRLPSKLAPSDKRYRGPLLYNPGGPGNSGVDAIIGLASSFQQIIGEEYDILSFDPRGFGRTTPLLRPYLNTQEDFSYAIRSEDDPPFSIPGAVARTYARFSTFGQISAIRLADTAPYVSTSQVARDMLAITKAAGCPKLKYWGVSYGTALGMTFASMFPDSVERLVLDGVVDGRDYYNAEWSHNLFTTDKGLKLFADDCAKAGPLRCALYANSGNAVLARIQKIFDSVKAEPIPVVVGNGTADYGIIDFNIVRRTTLFFLAGPFAIPAQNFALMMAGLEKRNGTAFWQGKLDHRSFLQCTSDSTLRPDSVNALSMGLAAVACGDADPVTDSVSELEKWYEANAKQSSLADAWKFRIVCAGWKVRPVEQFKGRIGANTSFPIMFIGKTADPTTPLANAKAMSKLFPKSAVLILDGPGHTSITTPSKCNSIAIRAYIRDGVLPKPGAVCSVDVAFFEDASQQTIRRDEFTEAVHAIASNAENMRQLWLF